MALGILRVNDRRKLWTGNRPCFLKPGVGSKVLSSKLSGNFQSSPVLPAPSPILAFPSTLALVGQLVEHWKKLFSYPYVDTLILQKLVSSTATDSIEPAVYLSGYRRRFIKSH